MFKFLIFLTLLTSCSTNISKNYLDSASNDLILEKAPKEEIKKESIVEFKVNIKSLNYTEVQQQNLLKASELIKKIFNSAEYKKEVIEFTFKGEKKFNENQNKTNDQIYEHLMGGSENLLPEKNNQMDLTVKMYYSWKSTIGYTYPTEMIVYTNSKFHKNFSPCEIASNLVHEWTHKMGYTHSMKWNRDRDFTVPYGHNTIVKKLCPLALEDKLTPN